MDPFLAWHDLGFSNLSPFIFAKVQFCSGWFSNGNRHAARSDHFIHLHCLYSGFSLLCRSYQAYNTDRHFNGFPYYIGFWCCIGAIFPVKWKIAFWQLLHNTCFNSADTLCTHYCLFFLHENCGKGVVQVRASFIQGIKQESTDLWSWRNGICREACSSKWPQGRIQRHGVYWW